MASSSRQTAYVTHPKDRRRTTRLWERFHVKGLDQEQLTDAYERMLLADWQRCQRFGIDPTMHKAVVIPDAEFRALLRQRAFLVERARPVLERVAQTLSGLRGILILTDHEGTILHIAGDPSVRLKAANYSLVEGGRWGEATSGTNGIGTAIAKRAPVHVYSSEHYCEGWQIWTCAGAPVIDPVSDALLAVVDFTAFEADFHPEAPSLSVSVAANIVWELRAQLEVERLHLARAYTTYRKRFPSEVVLVYDRLGRLVRHSPGIHPEDYAAAGHAPARFPAETKEIHPLFAPGSRTTIGSLVVALRRPPFAARLWLPARGQTTAPPTAP